MANLKNKPNHPVHQTELRHVPGIDQLETARLAELGYYRGYPCLHNHVIRDADHHWCYHCVLKIKNNQCGFDVNYLEPSYKHTYHALWKKIEIGSDENCWLFRDTEHKAPNRITLPSYRTHTNGRKDNVNVHKAIYQCAWGDIGSMVATRTCKTLNCCNPLHMVSSWNRLYAPNNFYEFDIEFNAQKLMQYANVDPRKLIEKKYKQTIAHPLETNEVPYYSEN
jgi:hypothetical protein